MLKTDICVLRLSCHAEHINEKVREMKINKLEKIRVKNKCVISSMFNTIFNNYLLIFLLIL